VNRGHWIANIVLYQLCWIAFVGGAGKGYWWPGFVVLVPFLIWQLKVSPWPRADLALVLIAAVLGFAMDTAMLQANLLLYSTAVPLSGIAPIWMVGLWMGFALTLNHSMAFLKRNLVLAVVLGAVFGPLAYWIAARAWSAVHLYDPQWQALVALAIAWGAITPVLVELASRLALREVGTR
jgi:Protein of unknown function (DUF2878)